MATSAYAQTLAKIAQGQYDQYKNNVETDKVLGAQIAHYWAGLGMEFPGVQTAWSAVFVSWCVKQAGATAKEFTFSAAHSVFVFHAIKNRLAGTGVFRGYRFNEIEPNVGDILQNNRLGHKYDYDFASRESQYFSHSAIVIAKGSDAKGPYITTVGGNESDSIRTKRIALDANGKILQRSSSPFICLIQDLK